MDLVKTKRGHIFALLLKKALKKDGAVAQLVEQWTENPCVGGSIPPHTTNKGDLADDAGSLFVFIYHTGSFPCYADVPIESGQVVLFSCLRRLATLNHGLMQIR